MKTQTVKQCLCGQWYEGRGENCPDCRKVSSSKTQHPLYNSYHANKFYRLWESYEDFYREVGEPPGVGYRLRGKIAGTSICPGNVRWEPIDKLEDLNLHTLTDVNQMLDPELRQLAAQAFTEDADTPITKIATLRRIEKEAKEKERPEDLTEWQLQVEKEALDYGIALKRDADSKQVEKGRGSQVRVGRALRRKLLPGLAIRLEEFHKSAKLQRSGRHFKIVGPLVEKLGEDYELIAHIALSCILDKIGRGSRMSTPMVQVLKSIGERLDHQAFLEIIKEREPQAWGRIDRWVLQSETTGYGHKIKRAKGLTELNYNFLSADDCVKAGEWCFNALQSTTGWFDTVKFWTQGKKKRTQYYLGLSETGLSQIDLIQRAQDEYAFEAYPMVCKPLRWENDQRGGYLKYHPGGVCDLIHRNMGTIPSPTAMEALHRAQEVAFKLNPFIYETQVQLLARSEEIGSFRTYEKDSWEDEHRPRIDPSIFELDRKYDKSRNLTPEYKQTMTLLKTFYSEQKKSEKQHSKVPFRVLKVAARYKDVERFYLPCYFDKRLRLYYTVDTITPNGADYQKALLMSADGKLVTDENRSQVENDLLITIANTWAQRENGVKTDKMTYEGRIAFAKDFVKELECVAVDPLTTAARCLWTHADEPFQFLACVREYFEVCKWHTKDHTHLFIGRDATNSGMQILGAISKDEKACYYTNVIPSDSPQDLYGEVAKEAQALLRSDVWVDDKIRKYTKEAKKKMQKREDEGKIFKAPDLNFSFGMDVDAVDRSVLKKAVMCTSYGASWGSKNEYISDEITEAFKQDPYNPTLTDKRLCTDASIEGQSTAFPQCDILNKWFKDFGKACMKAKQEMVEWKTPNGSFIRQEYREPLIKQVKTHAMGGGSYFRVDKRTNEGHITYNVQTGWGDVKENKSSTALGANWTHSLDACLLQNTIADYDNPFFTVHDCFYGLAGDMEEFCQKARIAFKYVIDADPMQNLVDSNGVDLDLPPMGTADISECLNAPYMFC